MSKEDILRQIKELEAEQPIKFHGTISNHETVAVGNDLDDLLSELEWDEEEDIQQFDTNDVSNWFE